MVDTELKDDEDRDRARHRPDSSSDSRLRPRSRSFFARISSASPLLLDAPGYLGAQNAMTRPEGQRTCASSHLELHLSILASGLDSKVAVSATAATYTADLARRLCIRSCNGVESQSALAPHSLDLQGNVSRLRHFWQSVSGVALVGARSPGAFLYLFMIRGQRAAGSGHGAGSVFFSRYSVRNAVDNTRRETQRCRPSGQTGARKQSTRGQKYCEPLQIKSLKPRKTFYSHLAGPSDNHRAACPALGC